VVVILMSLHVAKLGELLRATVQNTCERLSIGVCPLMRSHITLLDECLVTLAALERLFSGVSSYVSLQVAKLRESPATVFKLANVGSYAAMGPKMDSEVSLL